MAEAWLANPPCRENRYRKLHYPFKGSCADMAIGFALPEDDPREAYEISHLPGVGAYALDSFRIFHRDLLRGLSIGWNGEGATEEDFEPEWKRVVPWDKELRAFLKWMWYKEGWDWDYQTGKKERLEAKAG
jgi:methyl-CpG-binding domain protein 4